jgi:hypothetical protein
VSRSSEYLKIERRIAADERGGIMHRWHYGRAVLRTKVGRKQLPHGLLADLVKASIAAGYKISEREIRRRVQFAEVYDSEAKVGQALADFGSWAALAEAGFPPVEVDEFAGDAEQLELGAPDEWEQLSLIPGLAPTLKVGGRRIALADATVADIRAYRDMYAQVHENYGKRLALIEAALRAMLDGSRDENENAVDAWKRGCGS